MRVAYISLSVFADCDFPLVNALVEKGIDVTYYLIMSDNNKQGTIINVDCLKPEAKVYPASEYPTLLSLSSQTDLKRVRIVNMPIAHNYSWKSFVLAHRFKKELETIGFDIIHFTWPFDYCFFELYSLNIPILHTIHDPIPHSSDEKFIYSLQRKVAIRNSDYFLLLNLTQKESFKKRYSIADNKIFDSKLGIYSHLLNYNAGNSLYNWPYILFIGSINPHKGIKYLCKAMEELQHVNNNFHLVIAGKGNFDFNIKEYTDKGYIKVINRFIEVSELVNLVCHSRFVCCPYIDATQSGVVMTAFTLCKPVLATNVGALHEMVENTRHGMLVSPKDSHALAEAIVKMSNQSILNTMSENIKQDYHLGNNSWNRLAERLIENYNYITNK